MTAADRTRVALAAGFPLGALGHFWWLARHGLFYYGPGPPWAVWFWYGLCVADFIIPVLMLLKPRTGLAGGVATMVFTLVVNWTRFPTFEYHFNWVLLTLTAFGIAMAALTPWLWRASTAPLNPFRKAVV